MSSSWALGITGMFKLYIISPWSDHLSAGTFLGDYFGILMSKKVEGFPFNVLDNPMYVGSTMIFLSGALRWVITLTLLVYSFH